MSKCRNVQGVLAASLYESPEADEQRELQEHLNSCAACHAQYMALHAFVGAVPTSSIEFEGNLLPAIRDELHGSGSRSYWRLGQASLASLFVVVFVGLIAYRAVTAPEISGNDTANTPVAEASLVMDEVQARIADDDHAGAMAVLDGALSEAMREAGALQLAKADLEYDVFHRYEEAYAQYRQVREVYGEVWADSDPEIKVRYDLLTEARDDGFDALYEIDRAISQGETGLPVLEALMARYPGRLLAREAVDSMVAMVDGDGAAALEAVKSRCTNPLALAQLDVHLGERYVLEDPDPARGQALLRDVADGEFEVPAQMAKAVLDRLEPESN